MGKHRDSSAAQIRAYYAEHKDSDDVNTGTAHLAKKFKTTMPAVSRAKRQVDTGVYESAPAKIERYFSTQARIRGMRPSALKRKVLLIIAEDDMLKAILDD